MYRLGILIILVTLLVGCSPKEDRATLMQVEELSSQVELQMEGRQSSGESGLATNGEIKQNDFVVDHKVMDNDGVNSYYQVREELLLDFFKRYFGLSLEQRLVLNQDPATLDEEEKVIYQENISGLKENLLPYLSEAVQASLSGNYKSEKLHLPKLLEINNYITIGSSEVESAGIVSARPLGEHTIYEVEVITKEKVIDIVEANKRYAWDEDKKYYTDKKNSKKEDLQYTNNAFETAYNIEEALKSSYLFLQETPGDKEDEIRLVHRYWVEVRPTEGLVVESVEEANPFIMQEAYRQRASSNKHVTRIAYELETMRSEEQVTREVLFSLFSASKDFSKHYEKILQQEYQVVKDFFDTLDIKDQIILPKEQYKNAYHSNINPYKDNIEKIKTTKAAIKIEPSVSGTRKQHRFNVTIPAQILRKDNQLAYYEYKYLVGFEGGKIEFIHFLEIKQIALEEYERLAIE
ncbi:MAG: hypothetical protein RR744_02225 [Cellulosilyticaceae bacterium]